LCKEKDDSKRTRERKESPAKKNVITKEFHPSSYPPYKSPPNHKILFNINQKKKAKIPFSLFRYYESFIMIFCKQQHQTIYSKKKEKTKSKTFFYK
jgi:hypothetical protein